MLKTTLQTSRTQPITGATP